MFNTLCYPPARGIGISHSWFGNTHFFVVVVVGLIHVKYSLQRERTSTFYRIRVYRHSITQWGPREGQQREHFSLEIAAPVLGMVLGRRWGGQEKPHPAPATAPASAGMYHFLYLSPIPTPSKEPQELRLRRGSCSLGICPMPQEKYIPLNTTHVGEEGHRRAGRGRHPKRWTGGAPNQGTLTFAPLNKEDLLVFSIHSFLFEADCERQL